MLIKSVLVKSFSHSFLHFFIFLCWICIWVGIAGMKRRSEFGVSVRNGEWKTKLHKNLKTRKLSRCNSTDLRLKIYYGVIYVVKLVLTKNWFFLIYDRQLKKKFFKNYFSIPCKPRTVRGRWFCKGFPTLSIVRLLGRFGFKKF